MQIEKTFSFRLFHREVMGSFSVYYPHPLLPEPCATGLVQSVCSLNPDSIAKLFKSKMDGWKDVDLQIAITGHSGAGKSSFINTIRE